MKLFGLLIAAVLGSSVVIPLAASESEGIEEFEWLVGSWVRSGGKIQETWERLSNSLLEGASYIVDGETGAKRQDEWILLASMGDDFYYITKPGRNPEPVPFRLVATGTGSATFENLNHDFPQRIIYEQVGEAALTVTIEGPGDNGEMQRIVFAYERQK